MGNKYDIAKFRGVIREKEMALQDKYWCRTYEGEWKPIMTDLKPYEQDLRVKLQLNFNYLNGLKFKGVPLQV